MLSRATLTPARSHEEWEKRRDGGFTLLEVLVAFVIAALALGLLFQGGIGGLSAANAAARYSEALSRAQSHLAQASLGPDFQAEDRQGDEGGRYHWRQRVQLLNQAAAEPKQPIPALYAMTITVTWRDGVQSRSVTLQTQRVGTAPPAPP